MTTTARRELPVYPPTPPPRGDLTRAPIVGRFLRWKHARTALQIPLLLLALVIVADGLFGPDIAAQNAAGVAPWIQWRGLVVLALLVAGNLFCMACPFMLPRRLAKRWLPARRSWPAWLRTKWLALALLIAFFWAYEAFDLWNSPWLTAWLVIAYFAAAFIVDGLFRGAAFCKHVCPIGSFNFVNALASPGEVRVRSVAVCETCQTKDCITGRHEVDPRTGETRSVQAGCELWLFQPRKAGNMDCTFCLDCVQACPHDNVGLVARVPGRELVRDPWRSGLGRFSERPDVVALALATVFLAFVNAAGMIAPMRSLEAWIGGLLGTTSETAIWTTFLVLAVGVVPAALVLAAGAASRALAREGVATRTVVLRMSLGLVPLGFGMWLAHYAFHFLAGGLTLVPVLHRAAIDVGLAAGTPAWGLTGLVPAEWMLPLELVFLEAGVLGSIVLLHYISRATFHTRRAARRAFLPWALVAAGLGVAGGWIMNQPMDMRGMTMPGMDMPGMNMPGMDMPGMDMPGMDMPGMDMPEMDVPGPHGAGGNGTGHGGDMGAEGDRGG
jgi:polyferredoxin